jgi:pectin methylesterase-like acyl-CoA thioesterase
MKRFYSLILTLALAGTAFGKPKEKVYAASCDRVWAAVKIATAPPHYNFATYNDAEKKAMVSTGNNWSGKRYLDITLSGQGDSCTVAVGGQFSGITHNDKGDLFKRIQDALDAAEKEKKKE